MAILSLFSLLLIKVVKLGAEHSLVA